MKSYNHLYENAIALETRKKAVHNVIKGRKRMKNLERYSNDEDHTVELCLGWIENYRNAKHHPVVINDGISRKVRKIIVPTFEELSVQHCVVQALLPMFYHGMYEHTYASIPNRGSHKGKKVIQKWIKSDIKNCKYVLKMDIKHFFDSVPHDILKRKLAESIHDQKLLNLLCTIIDVTEVGLPLGFYTSQWLANWYLMGLDHFIKEDLGAAHYIRYMDDMVVFGSNKRKLHDMRKQIERYLSQYLGLHLKENWQVFRFAYKLKGKWYGRDLDFMGFRFFRDRTILRRSIMLKATRKARRVHNKDKPTIYDIRQMMSYLGWINGTDTYGMYEKWIKPYVSFQKYKRRISAYDKRKAKEVATL